MPPPTTSPTSAALAAASTTPAAMTLTSFALERISRNPALIGETSRSLRPPAAAAAPNAGSTSPRGAVDDAAAIPSTLDPAQRAVLAQAGASGSASTTNPGALLATTTLMQRAIVDAPLLPVGGCHLLHELVWPRFLASVEAARLVGLHRVALRQQQSTNSTSSVTTSSRAKNGVLDAGGGVLPTPLRAAEGASALDSSDARTAAAPATPDELSRSLSREALQVRLEQAQTQLADARDDLQRGLRKLGKLLATLRAYDAVPADELARQQQDLTRTLFTPVAVEPMSTAVAPTPGTPLASARSTLGNGSVLDAAGGDRKRQRDA